MRMTASETLEVLGEEPPAGGAVDVWSLMKIVSASISSEPRKAHTEENQRNDVAFTPYHDCGPCQTRNAPRILLMINVLRRYFGLPSTSQNLLIRSPNIGALM